MKNNYLALLKNISSQNFPIFIFGGFAEEALLFGKTTRKHDDVDILTLRKDTDRMVKLFQTFGFKDYEIYLMDPSNHPTVLHSENDGLAVEICIFDVDKSGRLYFDIYGETDKERFRIYLAKDVYDYPKSKLDVIEIQTVSPLAQYQIRAGLNITMSFGGYREKDIKSQKELKKKFFADKKAVELVPEIKKI